MMIKKRSIQIVVALLVIGCSISFLSFFKPTEYSYYIDYGPEGTCTTTTWENEYLPVWVKKCPIPDNGHDIVLQHKGTVDITFNNEMNILAHVVTPKNNELIIAKYYFPGWEVFVDGKQTTVSYPYSDYGFFATPISAGSHDIHVYYSQTSIMWFSDIISLLSLLIVCYIVSRSLLMRKSVRYIYGKKDKNKHT